MLALGAQYYVEDDKSGRDVWSQKLTFKGTEMPHTTCYLSFKFIKQQQNDSKKN